MVKDAPAMTANRPAPVDAVWCIVPAAGVGARMGGDRPKQYLSLEGMTVMDHTLSRLLSHPSVVGITLVLSAQDAYWPESSYYDHPGITLCPGGGERVDSVSNALLQLQSHLKPHDWIMVHDVARPCITHADIDRLLLVAASEASGVVLGAPVVDTLKWVGDAVIERTLDRRRVWRAFTPQLFRYQVLCDGIARARAQAIAITDEASAVECLGVQPLMLEGRADNIKITRPGDLELARFFLQQQSGL